MKLAEDQKRVLLAELARGGTAMSAAATANGADLAEGKRAALQAAVGASSAAGGVNDIVGLYDRQAALQAGSVESRSADTARRAQAYTGDLDLAAQGNVARRADVDRTVAVRRSELDRAIADRRADMESELAERRADRDSKIEAESERRATPQYRAAELRANRYLEDPDGANQRQRKDEALARAANINATGRDAAALLTDVRKHPEYGASLPDIQEAGRLGLSTEQLRAAMDKDGTNPVIRDLLLAEYVESQRKLFGQKYDPDYVSASDDG